jgi:hypothetical protein
MSERVLLSTSDDYRMPRTYDLPSNAFHHTKQNEVV